MIGLMDGASPQWLWLGMGLILAIGEMVIPGVFLIWLAGAALITGLVTWAVPIGMPVQVVLFAVLAIVSVFLGRNWLARNPVIEADPLMNDRGARSVGEVVQVTEAIGAGSGRVKLGDSEWLARGPDAEVGTKMRVAAHDGATLIVEHLH
ncbi:NfeD family protein [Novosphingobium sp.]|uniref:NfeD family protein n=1 Tax=Novosphingobium sp. TaxID=1874826 RepID=UPI0025E06E67|nr:NfeD family protein [Novosphingobium sp.]